MSDEEIVQTLRDRIEAERARRADAERLVAESRESERRYIKALTALTGEQAPTPRKRHSRAKNAHDWHISADKVELVYRRFVELRAQQPDTAISVGWIADQTPGLSPESTRRAFEELRTQERLRIVGKTRGGGSRWDLMPGAENGA